VLTVKLILPPLFCSFSVPDDWDFYVSEWRRSVTVLLHVLSRMFCGKSSFSVISYRVVVNFETP